MNKTRYLTISAMLAALGAVLMFFEFPLPLLPPFLKLDLSDIPVLTAAFVLGPIAAVAAALIKDIVHLSVTSSGGVGELADFLVTGSLVLTAGLLNKYLKFKFKAVVSCSVGVVVMTAIGCLANYFLILPFYSNMMPLKQIFEICSAVNPVVKDTSTYILYAVLPFNLIKGVLVSAVTLLIYKRLSNVTTKMFQNTNNFIGNRNKLKP